MSTTGPSTGSLVGFKRHLRAEVVSGEAVYLLSERGVTALKGAHAEALAPLLDGTRDLEGLRRDIPPEVTPTEAGSLITRLVEAGLVALRPAQPTNADDRTLAYWEAAGLDPATAVSGTEAARIQLITVGGVDGAAAMAALGSAGLTATEGSADVLADADLSVVLCDDYLSPTLADIDAAHRAAGRPWLLAKPIGAQVWIGPVFDPSEAVACWHCMATRLRGHRQAEAHLQATLGLNAPMARPVVALPSLTATAPHLIAMEAAKWAAGYRYPGQQQVWTFDSLDLRGWHHDLRARPQCPSCGDAGIMRAQAKQPVAIQHREKTSCSGGGHRSKPPEQVFDTYQHLISPVTGVLKEIKQDRRGPAFFNSFRAGPNVALGRRGLEHMRASLRAANGGKGITPMHGKVSALCEALERHSGHFHGDEERIRGSLESLADQAIHPDSCQLFHERQYADRASWNATHGEFQQVCDPFDEKTAMDWTPVWSLTEQRHKLLPTGLLYFDVPAEHDTFSVCADSNGNAAGSSLEDAVLQGMLELVERDAVALWWYNRTKAPAVNLDAFGDPWIDQLREVYAALNREVWVLDVTSDTGIPTMAALSRRTDKPCEDVMFGFGAHLDPSVALTRALTEMNQLMPAVANVGLDDRYGWNDPEAMHWWRTATVDNQPYLVPDNGAPSRGPGDFGYTPTTDLYQDISTTRGRLETLGLEVLVLDQTRPDIGLPVVKVIVPGMRGFWARFAPGRLYDVPVRLGRVARPTAYEDLNPLPLFV